MRCQSSVCIGGALAARRAFGLYMSGSLIEVGGMRGRTGEPSERAYLLPLASIVRSVSAGSLPDRVGVDLELVGVGDIGGDTECAERTGELEGEAEGGTIGVLGSNGAVGSVEGRGGTGGISFLGLGGAPPRLWYVNTSLCEWALMTV